MKAFIGGVFPLPYVPHDTGTAMAIEDEVPSNSLVWMLREWFGDPEPCYGQCCVRLEWRI